MRFKQLKNYFAILEGKRKPKFMCAPLEKLERTVEELMEECRLCERRCGVNRLEGERGLCRAPPYLLISSEFVHYGEESFFVPSHTIFFMGCNFRCVYCQNYTISQWVEEGFRISEEELARRIEMRWKTGARNANFVGGEPTPYLLSIIRMLKILRERNVEVPVVWNSNFFMSKKVMKILNQIVDVYLPDFKYGNNKCAQELSFVDNYFDVITRNLKLAEGELVIRHLVLPGHVECCSFPVLEWVAENLKNRAVVNIMDQYYPTYIVPLKPELQEINRKITREEFERVIEKAKELGLTFIF